MCKGQTSSTWPGKGVGVVVVGGGREAEWRAMRQVGGGEADLTMVRSRNAL